MKFLKRCKNNNGFTLIEVLISLFTLSLATVILLGCVNIMSKLSILDYQSEDHIAIMQLRFILAQSEKLRIQDGALFFEYHKEPFQLEFHNRRLVKRIGYEIFLKDVDDIKLYEEGGCYYVGWQRENNYKSAILSCE